MQNNDSLWIGSLFLRESISLYCARHCCCARVTKVAATARSPFSAHRSPSQYLPAICRNFRRYLHRHTQRVHVERTLSWILFAICAVRANAAARCEASMLPVAHRSNGRMLLLIFFFLTLSPIFLYARFFRARLFFLGVFTLLHAGIVLSCGWNRKYACGALQLNDEIK